jgi:multidrug efflux pump
MNPSRLFILRPVATSLLMVAVLLTGIVAYRELSTSALPQVDYPTIQVTTFYPGASPDVMTSSVTAPLERQLGQVPGLEQMSSISSVGASVITLRFSSSCRSTSPSRRSRPRSTPARTCCRRTCRRRRLLEGQPGRRADPDARLTSKTLPLTEVRASPTRASRRRSRSCRASARHARRRQAPAVRVQANPTSLAARGLSLDDLRTAIAAAKREPGKGSFDGPSKSLHDRRERPAALGRRVPPVVVAYRNGAPIHLEDVADVVEDAENVRLAAWVERGPGIVLSVQRQPGANVIEVVDRIQELLPQLTAALPAAVDVRC